VGHTFYQKQYWTSAGLYCSINGCLRNPDLELLFGQLKAAWESDAAIIDTGETQLQGSCYGFLG
jgi:hypothetical protein